LSIGSRVIQIRNQKDLTQQQVSQRSGIAPSYLSRIENRRIEPGPKTLRRIAEALGVPVSEFFQESQAALKKSRCAITSSGSCIMDLLRSGRGKAASASGETYTPQQLQLLRMANYLIQSGDHRILDALDLLLSAMLSSQPGSKSKSRRLRFLRPVQPAEAPQGEPL
jgi:transcriptional regulator with XRE-family HTH domain